MHFPRRGRKKGSVQLFRLQLLKIVGAEEGRTRTLSQSRVHFTSPLSSRKQNMRRHPDFNPCNHAGIVLAAEAGERRGEERARQEKLLSEL